MDSLKGSVVEFIDPMEPVGVSDWEAIEDLNKTLSITTFRNLSDARLMGLALTLAYWESSARMVMEERGLTVTAERNEAGTNGQ